MMGHDFTVKKTVVSIGILSNKGKIKEEMIRMISARRAQFRW